MVSEWRDALWRCVGEDAGVVAKGVASRLQVLVAGYISGVCDVFAETGEMVYDEKSMGRNVQALRRGGGYIPRGVDRCWHGLLWVARCNNEDRMGLELCFSAETWNKVRGQESVRSGERTAGAQRDASRGNSPETGRHTHHRHAFLVRRQDQGRWPRPAPPYLVIHWMT